MAQLSSSRCHLCSDNNGYFYCYDCEHFLCQGCKTIHDKIPSTKEHTVIDSQKEGHRVFKPKPVCEVHKKDYSYYCNDCDGLICSECVISVHKGHTFGDYMNAVQQHRQNIIVITDTLKSKVKLIGELLIQIETERMSQITSCSDEYTRQLQVTADEFYQVIDCVTTINKTAVSDFNTIELEKVAKIQTNLERIQNHYTEILSKCEHVLIEKHHVTFLFEQKALGREIENLDEIPDIPETNMISGFNQQFFTANVVEKIKARFDISILKEKEKEIKKLEEKFENAERSRYKQKQDSDSLIKQLNDRLNQKESQMKKLQKDKETLEGEIVKAKGIADEKTKEIRCSEKRLKEESSKLVDLQRSKDDVENILKNREKEIKELQEKVKNTEKRSNKQKQESDNLIKELRDRQHQMESQINTLQSDKGRLEDEIVYPNRAFKLAAMYQSLYDNEWTDALDILMRKVDEEVGIRHLLEIKKDIYRFCYESKADLLKDLAGRFLNPISGWHTESDTSGNQEDKQIKDILENCLKIKAKTAIPNLQKSYLQINPTQKPIFADEIPEFVNKCIALCWLMNTQRPPLVFGEQLQAWQSVDRDQYKEYTRQGDLVSFVVLLPLLIEKNGAVLSKGVVQPVPYSRSLKSLVDSNVSKFLKNTRTHISPVTAPSVSSPYANNTSVTTCSGTHFSTRMSLQPKTKNNNYCATNATTNVNAESHTACYEKNRETKVYLKRPATPAGVQSSWDTNTTTTALLDPTKTEYLSVSGNSFV